MTIFGVAWSHCTPLDRVEVRVDGGAWRAAEQDRPDDPYGWTFFTLEVPALPAGEHLAGDGHGGAYPARPARLEEDSLGEQRALRADDPRSLTGCAAPDVW